MKDYRTKISSQQANSITSYFIENDYDVVCAEGSLIDNYLIKVGENNLKLGKVKLRKYIIIIGKYLNEWSSTLEMILTDNEEMFESFHDKLTEV